MVRADDRSAAARHIPGLAISVSLSLAAICGAADEAPAAPVFGDSVDVDVVNVEVYVTDRRGEPVTGLTAADFQILEDGRPVAVSNFYAVEGGRPTFPGGEMLADPKAAAASGPAPLPADQRLYVIFLIDNLNLGPVQRNRVLPELKRFVAGGLGPQARAMVASLDGSSVSAVQGFTTDRAELFAAFDEIAARSSMIAAAADVERREILGNIDRVPLPAPGTPEGPSIAVSEAREIFHQIEGYGERHYRQIFTTVEALAALVESVAGIPGRKAIVFVSEGLSLRPGEALFYAWRDKFSVLEEYGLPELDRRALRSMLTSLGSSTAEYNATAAVRELGKLANRSRVTFYALRPGALTHVTAEDGLFDSGAIGTPGGGRTWSAGLDAIESESRSASMWELAEVTGGFAVTRAGGFDVALGRLRRELDTYYSLGYAPPRERDGKEHRIEVKVGVRGVRVRHRESHRDKSRAERMTDRAAAALIYEEGANPLQVAVEVAAGYLDEQGHQRVPVMIKIPISNLVLVPGDLGLHGQVSIYVGARDGQGRSSPIRTLQAPIRIARAQLAQAAGQVAGYRVLLEMRPGDHTVVVGVRDDVGGTESTALVLGVSIPAES